MDDIRINKILPEKGKLYFNKAEVNFLYFNNKKVWPKVDAVEIPIKDSLGNELTNIVFNNVNGKNYDKHDGWLYLEVAGTPEIVTNNNNCIKLSKTIEGEGIYTKVLYKIEYLNYGNATIEVNPKDTNKYKKAILPVECNEFIFEHNSGQQVNNVDASGTRNIQITIKSQYNGNFYAIDKSNITTDCDWITINDDISENRSTNTITFSYNVNKYLDTVNVRSANITVKPNMPSDMHDIKDNYVPELSYRITQSAVKTETMRIMYGGNESHEVINNNHIDLYINEYNDLYDYQNPFNADYSDERGYQHLSLYDSNNNAIAAKFESSDPIIKFYTTDNLTFSIVHDTLGGIANGQELTITATPLNQKEHIAYDIQPISLTLNRIHFELEKRSNTIDWNDSESKYISVTLDINGEPVDTPAFELNFDDELLDVQQHDKTIEYKFIKPNTSENDEKTSISVAYMVNKFRRVEILNLIQSVRKTEIPIKDESGNSLTDVVFNNINGTNYDVYKGLLRLNVDGTLEIKENDNNCIEVDQANKAIQYLSYGQATVVVEPNDKDKYNGTELPVTCNEFIFEHNSGKQSNNVDAIGTESIQVTIKSQYNGSFYGIDKTNITTDCDWIIINDNISENKSNNTITFSYSVKEYGDTENARTGNIVVKPDMPSSMSDINHDVKLSYEIIQSARETKTLYIKYAGDESNVPIEIENNRIDLYILGYDNENVFNVGYENDDRNHKYTILSLYDDNNNSVPVTFKIKNSDQTPIVELHSSDNITAQLKCNNRQPMGEEYIIEATPLNREEGVEYVVKPITVSMNQIIFTGGNDDKIDWNDNNANTAGITLMINLVHVTDPEFIIEFDENIIDAEQKQIATDLPRTVKYKFIKRNLAEEDITSNIDITYHITEPFKLTRTVELIHGACPDTAFIINGPESLQSEYGSNYELEMNNITKDDLDEIIWTVNNTDGTEPNTVEMNVFADGIKVNIINKIISENISETITITCKITDNTGSQKTITKDITCYAKNTLSL